MTNLLVDVDEAMTDLEISFEEYIEMVEDLQSYLGEYYDELEVLIERDNKSGVEEVAHTLKGALQNLRFIVAADVAQRLEKYKLSGEDDPSALLRELKQIVKRSITAIGIR